MIRFEIVYTLRASKQRRALEYDPNKARVWKAARKTLAMMEANLRHPGLRTHKFHGQKGPQGQDVFEAYAQNHTPGAHRIF
ncbi:MAG: hypothetical protein HKL90_10045 [Elusimicrobia bacterium]|nr:hypothetical protein [Elusimicrobiota bacterium]